MERESAPRARGGLPQERLVLDSKLHAFVTAPRGQVKFHLSLHVFSSCMAVVPAKPRVAGLHSGTAMTFLVLHAICCSLEGGDVLLVFSCVHS